MKRNRLTDNDINLGPFTIGEPNTHWRPIGITIESGCDEYPGCSLQLYTGWRTVRIALPQIVRPWRRKIVADSWDAATVARIGRNWYWDVYPREYGFRLSDGFLQVFLGPQTHDSTTTKSWFAHLPWTQWRFVRESWYGLNGEHLHTLRQTSSREVRRAQADWRHHFTQNELPKARFLIEDCDGTRVMASTSIEEREWRFGEGLFAWLSLFRKPRIRRSLSIDFEKEVGPEKGSWKGGLMGTGIDMLPGELHEDAFRRFCDKDIEFRHRNSRIKFLGAAS